MKSTVPVELLKVQKIVETETTQDFSIVSNPEFLKEEQRSLIL